MPRRKQPLYCSFCRRDDSVVQKLIAGPGIYICDACVALVQRHPRRQTAYRLPRLGVAQRRRAAHHAAAFIGRRRGSAHGSAAAHRSAATAPRQLGSHRRRAGNLPPGCLGAILVSEERAIDHWLDEHAIRLDPATYCASDRTDPRRLAAIDTALAQRAPGFPRRNEPLHPRKDRVQVVVAASSGQRTIVWSLGRSSAGPTAATLRGISPTATKRHLDSWRRSAIAGTSAPTATTDPPASCAHRSTHIPPRSSKPSNRGSIAVCARFRRCASSDSTSTPRAPDTRTSKRAATRLTWIPRSGLASLAYRARRCWTKRTGSRLRSRCYRFPKIRRLRRSARISSR